MEECKVASGFIRAAGASARWSQETPAAPPSAGSDIRPAFPDTAPVVPDILFGLYTQIVIFRESA